MVDSQANQNRDYSLSVIRKDVDHLYETVRELKTHISELAEFLVNQHQSNKGCQ